MLVGTVVGRATSTVKHTSIENQKLLVVQPTLADGTSSDGNPLVAVDSVGAGLGERVVITSDGRFVRERLGAPATPVRWTVVAIENE